MGLSRRKYAEYRGVSESAVRKAIGSGRISVEADGTIDPTKADAEWDSSTDPAKQRGKHAQSLGAKSAAATAQAKAGDLKPVPQAAFDAVNSTLTEAGEQAPADVSGGEVSFVKAKMANEVLKAQTAKVRLQKMKGELVDRPKAESDVFALGRRERDAWINWPARVAANMAAELGIEAHTLEVTLDKYLRLHLADLAEIRVELH